MRRPRSRRTRYAEALAELDGVKHALASAADERLAVRHRLARGWALQHLGRLDEALSELSAAGGTAVTFQAAG